MASQVQDKADRIVNRRGKYIAMVVTINLVVMVISVVYSNYLRYQQVQKIGSEAAEGRAKADLTEKQLLDYMQRTVQRWDTLQKLNPQLEVPRASEPQPPGKEFLTEKELQRGDGDRPPRPTPTASPIASKPPKAKTRTVIKYKKAPTPTPFHFF